MFEPVTITDGLLIDDGVYGTGVSGSPGHVQRTITGTGHAGCTLNVTVTDARRPTDANNNRTLTTTIDATGHWSVDLNLDDCDPIVEVVEICDGAESSSIRRHTYVDGTPPVFRPAPIVDCFRCFNVSIRTWRRARAWALPSSSGSSSVTAAMSGQRANKTWERPFT